MRNNFQRNSIKNQQDFLLALLKTCGNFTTLEARNQGVMHPSARILELKEKGWKIITHRTIQHDSQGNPRKIAKYVLMGKLSSLGVAANDSK